MKIDFQPNVKTFNGCENDSAFCIDRRKVNVNNIPGVILSVTDDEFYKVETKNGILTSL